MDSQNIDNNEIGLSQGSLNLRMKVKPLVPGEIFYNYAKTDLASNKIVGNPYEIWIGTTNPTKPVRIGAQGGLVIYGNYKSFFEVFQNNGPATQYAYTSTLPKNGTRGLRVGNIYKIDKDIIIYETDTTPKFIGGDLAVYLGDNKWWNLTNSQLADDIYYVPVDRGESVEDSDYEYTDSVSKTVRSALDNLFQTKAGLNPSGKLYKSQFPDEFLKKFNNNLVVGPFEVQNDNGYNKHDTLGVNPRYREYVSSNGVNRMDPHTVNVKGNFTVKSFKSSLVFGDSSDTKVLGVPGTNKLFGMPFNYPLPGFKPLGQDIGSADIERDITVGRTTRTKNMFYSDFITNDTMVITKNNLVTNENFIIGKTEFDRSDLSNVVNILQFPTFIKIDDSLDCYAEVGNDTYKNYNLTANNIKVIADDKTFTADSYTATVEEANLNIKKVTVDDIDITAKSVTIAGTDRSETFTGITSISKPKMWSFTDEKQPILKSVPQILIASDTSVMLSSNTSSAVLDPNKLSVNTTDYTLKGKTFTLGKTGEITIDTTTADKSIMLKSADGRSSSIIHKGTESDLEFNLYSSTGTVNTQVGTVTNILSNSDGLAKLNGLETGSLSSYPSGDLSKLASSIFSKGMIKSFYNVKNGSSKSTQYLLLGLVSEKPTSKFTLLGISSSYATLFEIIVTNGQVSFTSQRNNATSFVAGSVVTGTYNKVSYYALKLVPSADISFTYYLDGTSTATDKYTGSIVTMTDVADATDTELVSYFNSLNTGDITAKDITAEGLTGTSLTITGDTSVASISCSSVTSTGAVKSSGAVSGASVSATGEVSGKTLSATGGVSGNTLSATTSISGQSLSINSGKATIDKNGNLSVASISVNGKVPLMGSYSNGVYTIN